MKINLKNAVSTRYDIRIGIGLESAVKDIHRNYPLAKIFVITDTNVYRCYGKLIGRYFRENEFKVLVVPAGEKSKNRKMKEILENKLLSLDVSRDSVIIAFGGGVVGDIAGYVAATLLRGIPFIQIPTTLLSQVDSSIGGKVGINHPLGKNLIGTFYHPKKVYIDLQMLETLPGIQFRNGMAEVIKYAAILDEKLFSFLENNYARIAKDRPATTEYLVNRCCELKKMIVEKDERENGLRRILNFGHTIGHSLETLSKYRLLHGDAVAIGMAAEAKISVLLGLLDDSDLERLVRLLHIYRLPARIPRQFSLNQIIHNTLTDKKVKDSEVQYTLLDKIGKAHEGVPLSESDVLRMLSA